MMGGHSLAGRPDQDADLAVMREFRVQRSVESRHVEGAQDRRQSRVVSRLMSRLTPRVGADSHGSVSRRKLEGVVGW
jgi:hypothetical protein